MSIPNSRRNLDIAIERLAKDGGEAVRIRRTMANAIVGQLLPDVGSHVLQRVDNLHSALTVNLFQEL